MHNCVLVCCYRTRTGNAQARKLVIRRSGRHPRDMVHSVPSLILCCRFPKGTRCFDSCWCFRRGYCGHPNREALWSVSLKHYLCGNMFYKTAKSYRIFAATRFSSLLVQMRKLAFAKTLVLQKASIIRKAIGLKR